MKSKRAIPVFAALVLQAASFDVASVKPANPNAVGSNTDSDPGRITMQNVTLKRCIMRAYEVPDLQITGGQSQWLDARRYDIEARAGYPAQYAELNQMLQTGQRSIDGNFDFTLRWIPDGAADPTAGPSLFTALVVDSAEPPSAN